MDYLIVLSRTLLFYIIITIIYRFMGKREIGQLGIVDLIVSILIAELAAISIDNREESVFLSILPIVLLVVIQVGMSYISLKSSKIRNAFDGNPSVIINNGTLNFNEMVRQRYNLEDLLTQVRDKGIKSLDEVEYAILENNGKLSIFLKDDKNVYPMPLIIDGVINYQTLVDIKKDKLWLMKMLKNEHTSLEQVFYAFYKNNKCFIIKKNWIKL